MKVPAGSALARRSRRLLLVLSLPLFVVVLVLALLQYRDQRRQLLGDMATALAGHAVALDAMAKVASDHVRQMQSWSERTLAQPATAPSAWRAHLQPRVLADGRPDGYTLDAVPQGERRHVGQLLWLGADPRDAGSDGLLLDHALEFFGLVRLTHDTTPYLRWSYFLPASRDHVAMYPWGPSRDMIEGAGHGSVREGIDKGFETEVYNAGLLQADPGAGPYWTAPYLDLAGAGAMVSAGAAVRQGGRFRGVVGTDLTLASLDAFVAALAREGGRLWVLDDHDRVLAGSAGGGRSGALLGFGQAEPGAGAALASARAAPGVSAASGGLTLVARRVEHAPWTLVHVIGDAEVRALLLPRFVPYGVILAALAASVALALVLLRREFIAPALGLAGYIERLSQGAAAPPPRLARLWQPLADEVGRSYEASRLATERAQEGDAFKSAIVDNALLAVITMDESGRIVEFNRAAVASFGFEREAALGRDVAELLIPPAQHERWRALLDELLACGGACVGDGTELDAVRRDGRPLPIEVSISSTQVHGRRYYTAFVADLTQRREADSELARQREALRQSEKLSAMGALLAGVAHELNNPLAILMGRSALLERRARDPAVKADALKIHAAADRCGRIVRTFLAMARQRPVQRRRIALADVVAGALDLVGYSLRSSGIEVELSLDEDLPHLEADADQIGQVLVNLLINAQQALGERPEPRRVRISAAADAGAAVLRVADNGPGVPPELRERIFDPFVTTKPEGSGTGVGLSVSRAIAREHRGELALLESAAGAVFELRLPLHAAADRADPAAGAPAEPPPAPAGCALVVDDEAEVSQLLCEILHSAGCDAVAVASGREALAWLATHECSFILSDIRMPDLDGPALWRELQQRHPELVPHLAFVTGDTLSASVAPFLRETGLPSLEKPFTPEEVLELVARIERT